MFVSKRGKKYLCKCDDESAEVEAHSAAVAADRYATRLHVDGDDYLGSATYRVKVRPVEDTFDEGTEVYDVRVRGEVRFSSTVKYVRSEDTSDLDPDDEEYPDPLLRPEEESEG